MLKLQRVEFIPDQIDPGVLYVSEKYATAIHRCCCGCGEEVVTPLAAHKWQMRVSGTAVTLTPSIGNWNLPCRSHYWIRAGAVIWAAPMTAAEIRRVQTRDKRDAERYVAQRNAATDRPVASPVESATEPNDTLLIEQLWRQIRHWLTGRF